MESGKGREETVRDRNTDRSPEAMESRYVEEIIMVTAIAQR